MSEVEAEVEDGLHLGLHLVGLISLLFRDLVLIPALAVIV